MDLARHAAVVDLQQTADVAALLDRREAEREHLKEYTSHVSAPPIAAASECVVGRR